MLEDDIGLEAFVLYENFFRKQAVRNWNRFKSPIVVPQGEFTLPKSSMVHFIPESITEYGISSSHPLLYNIGERITVYHQTESKDHFGVSRVKSVQPESMIRRYHKRNKFWRWARTPNTVFANERIHSVANYGLLPHLRVYFKNIMSGYHEWYNLRMTMWETVEMLSEFAQPVGNIEIANERAERYLQEHQYREETGEIDELISLEERSMLTGKYHFIPFTIPDRLPSRQQFDRFAKAMDIQGVKVFNTKAGMDLLDLWCIIDPEVKHPVKQFSPDTLFGIHLSFIESGRIVTVRLYDLVQWAEEKPTEIKRALWNFFESIRLLRTGTNVSQSDEVLQTLDERVKSINENEDYDEDEEEDVKEDVEWTEGTSLTGTDSVDLDEDIDEEANVPTVDEVTVSTPANTKVARSAPVTDFGKRKIENLTKELGSLGLLSGAEQRALKKMTEQFKEIKLVKQVTQDGDLTLKKEDLKLEVPAVANVEAVNVHDSTLGESTLEGFRKKYLKEMHPKVTLNMMLGLQSAGVVVKDIKKSEKRTAVSSTDTYSLTVKPVDGEQSTLSITVPHIEEDGTFLSGGVRFRMDMQRSDYPIWKIQEHMVALTSYAGKQFVIRNRNSSNNYEKWITKFLNSRALNPEDKTVTDLISGTNKILGKSVPRAYSAIAASINGFKSGPYNFTFNYSHLNEHFGEDVVELADKMEMVPCGRTNKGNFLFIDKYNSVWEISGSLDKSVVPIPLGGLPQLIDATATNGPKEFCELTVRSKRIPIIVVLSYLLGLDNALARCGIKFTTIASGERTELREDQYRLTFKDEAYILTVDTLEKQLMVSGFSRLVKQLRMYTVADMNNRKTYGRVVSTLGCSQNHLRELALMDDMFIDPITLKLLQEFKEPDNYIDLLIKANDLLVDDYLPTKEPQRIKGYERIPGMIYKQLVDSVRAKRSRRGDGAINLNPKSVWLDVLNDPSVVVVEDSNPIHSIKEKSVVTATGQGGRSTVSLTKETRGFKAEDLGVYGESNPDSGKAGVRNYLTANPNIGNMLGILETKPLDKLDSSSTLSMSSLLAPGMMHDDAKRASFTDVQNSSTVQAYGYEVPPFRTGAEKFVAGRSGENFAYMAPQPGKVLSVTKDAITVEYEDGTKEMRRLGVKHGVVSGGHLPHELTTLLKKGDSFKALQPITFNAGYFEEDLLDKGNINLKFSLTANVAFNVSSDTHEDGCNVSTSLERKLSTRITHVRDVVVPFDAEIFDLVEEGTELTSKDILCTLDYASSNQYFSDDDAAYKGLKELTNLNPRAEHPGYISRIEVFYYGELEDMTESLRNVCETYDKERAKRAKMKGENKATTGKVDEVIRINGRKLQPGFVGIQIYVDSDLGVTTGDKFVIANQLRTTVSRMIETPIHAEDGREVLLEFSMNGPFNRIVGSWLFQGLGNAILTKATKNLINDVLK